jgi:hypothetical protein
MVCDRWGTAWCVIGGVLHGVIIIIIGGVLHGVTDDTTDSGLANSGDSP